FGGLLAPEVAPQLGTAGVNAMRAGEIANYATDGSLPGSAAVAKTGGLLGSIPIVGDVAGWMKANPLLGRLVTAGLTTALTSGGGNSSS
ncbi:hypothetical protein, partial [Streptococcus pneumoniae]|uniref:hypothetical protein n=1 Tax=Streptococcus pneumoniae TaxID=1313 RepID=UPI001E36511F